MDHSKWVGKARWLAGNVITSLREKNEILNLIALREGIT
jgi:hypothetical protein